MRGLEDDALAQLVKGEEDQRNPKEIKVLMDIDGIESNMLYIIYYTHDIAMICDD